MLPIIKRLPWLSTCEQFFAGLLAHFDLADSRQSHLLRVLMYHRVDEPETRPDLDPTLLSAMPATFDAQMRFLAEHYRVVSMEEVLEACRTRRPLPPRAVLITFDDAYRDFAEHAWPILQRYGLSATLFVPTAYPDHPERAFWWDRLYHAFFSTPRQDAIVTPLGRVSLQNAAHRVQAFRCLKVHLKRLPHAEAMAWVDRISVELEAPTTTNHVLGWNTLRRLASEGVTLGAHTQTHPLLSRVDAVQASLEICGAMEDLHRQVGPVLPVFAYPDGDFNETVVQVLQHLDVALALTTSRGLNDLAGADLLRLRRIHVGRRTSLPILRAQLLPWFLRP